MGFIEDELSEVKRLCENVVPGSKLVSCVRSMVRVQISKTDYKTIVLCMQFPEDYPKALLLMEVKSKTLSESVLCAILELLEQHLKQFIGKAQILNAIKFLHNFIESSPVSVCCYNEIKELKKKLSEDDELKVKEKSSSLTLKVSNSGYYWKSKITIPDNYPQQAIDLHESDSNFSPAFYRHMVAQAREIARRCVEPPIKKKQNEVFKPSPSLQKTVEFLIDCVKRLPQEKCQICNEVCFPSNPELLETNENAPKHIERVFCGHLFHFECFMKFMKSPPFGNKTCNICGSKIYHFKWSLSDKLAEQRWAYQQARERELQEVQDFFN